MAGANMPRNGVVAAGRRDIQKRCRNGVWGRKELSTGKSSADQLARFPHHLWLDVKVTNVGGQLWRWLSPPRPQRIADRRRW